MLRTDAELIAAYSASRDEGAFGELVSRHWPMVYRACLALVGETHEAEDCCQAVFVVLVRRIRSLGGGGNLAAWLYGVARHVCLRAGRDRAARARREEAAAMKRQSDREPDAESAGGGELLELIYREIGALPAAERQAVILHHLEGRSVREAAEVAGCPQGTMARRASNALARLRTRLAGRGQHLAAAPLAGMLAAQAASAVPEAAYGSIVSLARLASRPSVAAASGPANQAFSLAEGAMKAMFWAHVKLAACAVAGIAIVVGGGTVMIRTLPAWKARPAAMRTLRFDRAKLHAQAVEESLVPVHPGEPGKIPFWNGRGQQFMYAPAFDFATVPGAAAYRFTATAYGPGWSLETEESRASLEPIWQDLPDGELELQFCALGARRETPHLRGPAEYEGKPFTKEPGAPAASFEFPASEGATGYRFIVRAPKQYVFEADQPCASLAPIWKDLPAGKVILGVQGLDRKGGRVLGNSGSRTFERKAVFNGPYHGAALDYTEAGRRWLQWLADSEFKCWTREGDPEKLAQFPCKHEAAAIAGLTALATLETDAARRGELLGMARNAARTLIKGSFPADWALAHWPPTYGKGGGYGAYETVLVQEPAEAALAYLDLHAATGETEFLDAAVRIAEVYRRTQSPDGSWPVLLDGRSGAPTPRSEGACAPWVPLRLLERLSDEHGLAVYRPVARAAWQRVEREVLPPLRFEGQFENSCLNGGSAGNLAQGSACSAAEELFRRAGERPEFVPLAEDALRLAEDQFVFWETPPHPEQFTPCVLEQYGYMVSVQASAAHFIGACGSAYEVTGEELYLAKAAALANAMTVLQKESGGSFVSTSWRKDSRWGNWPNCHVYSARQMIRFGELLERHGLRVPVAVPTVDAGGSAGDR